MHYEGKTSTWLIYVETSQVHKSNRNTSWHEAIKSVNKQMVSTLWDLKVLSKKGITRKKGKCMPGSSYIAEHEVDRCSTCSSFSLWICIIPSGTWRLIIISTINIGIGHSAVRLAIHFRLSSNFDLIQLIFLHDSSSWYHLSFCKMDYKAWSKEITTIYSLFIKKNRRDKDSPCISASRRDEH